MSSYACTAVNYKYIKAMRPIRKLRCFIAAYAMYTSTFGTYETETDPGPSPGRAHEGKFLGCKTPFASIHLCVWSPEAIRTPTFGTASCGFKLMTVNNQKPEKRRVLFRHLSYVFEDQTRSQARLIWVFSQSPARAHHPRLGAESAAAPPSNCGGPRTGSAASR